MSELDEKLDHLIRVIVSNAAGGCSPTTEQLRQLRDELAAHGGSVQSNYQGLLSAVSQGFAEVEELRERLQSLVTGTHQESGKPSLQERLDVLKQRRLDVINRARDQDVHIPLMCSTSRELDPEAKEATLIEDIKRRIAQVKSNQVCSILVLGPCGAGKTTEMQQLEKHYWESFEAKDIGTKPQMMPIFLELSQAALEKNRETDIRTLAIQELKCMLTEDDIQELERRNISIVWMFDGYDEMGGVRPIREELTKCGLSIVSCRQQFVDGVLEGDITRYLAPGPDSFGKKHHVLYLRRPNQEQVLEYVTKVFERGSQLSASGTPEGFVRVIESVPSLKELASTPFMLSLIVGRIPRLVEQFPQLQSILKSGDSESEEKHEVSPASELLWGIRIKSTDIFGMFLQDHYNKSVGKLMNAPGWPNGFEADFNRRCETFCTDLAAMMFGAFTLIADREQAPFKELFPDDDASDEGVKLSFILQAVPLQSPDGKHWSFMHRSLWEYYLALSNAVSEPPRALSLRLFTQDQDLLQKHAELLADHPNIKKAYIDLVLGTRHKLSDAELDGKLVVAASNAISIINFGGLSGLFVFRFRDVKDWSGIRIPHANLNCAQILGCKLDDSDLSSTTMSRAVLRGSSFRGANLRGIWTGERSPLRGHTVDVTSVSFSPDGKLLASGSMDTTIRLWDVESGACLFTFKGHSWSVKSICFSPNGKLLASASWSTIRLWNVASRKCVGKLTGHTGYVECVRFSPDGKSLVSSGKDGTLRFWEVASGSSTDIVQGYQDAHRLDFSPDGTLLAVGGSGDIVLLKVGSKERPGSFKGHERSVNCLSFSPDGRLLASDSQDRTIRVWEVESKRCIASLKGHTGWIHGLAFTPDGKLLASGSDDHTIRLWDLESQRCISTLKGHANVVNSVSFRGDGRWLASGSRDNTIRLWNIVKSVPFTPTMHGHADGVTCVRFSPDGKRFASCSRDRTIRMWDAESDQCTAILLGPSGRVMSATFSPDGKWLASGSSDNTIRVWNVESSSCKAILRGHEAFVNSVSFSPDGGLLASGGDDYTLRLWNVESGECTASLNHEGVVSSVWFHPHGRFVVSGGHESVQLWNVASKECIHTWNKGFSRSNVGFSPDGKLLAAGSGSRIELWDFESKESVGTLGDNSLPDVSSLCFSLDGEILAAGSEDGEIWLWRVVSKQCIGTFQGSPSSVKSLSFSPVDGKTLVSAYDDGSIRVWVIEAPHVQVSLRAVLASCYALDLAGTDFSQAEMDPGFRQLVAYHQRSESSALESQAPPQKQKGVCALV